MDNKNRNKEYKSQVWDDDVSTCTNCGSKSNRTNIEPRTKNIWGIPLGTVSCIGCTNSRKYDLQMKGLWTGTPIEPIDNKDIDYNREGGFVKK